MLSRLYFSAIPKYYTANKIDSEHTQDYKRLIPVCQVEMLRVTVQAQCALNQGFSWTEIYFGHFVQAAPILFGHLEIF